MQQEMVRFRHGNAGSLPLFFRTAFKPLIEKLQQAVIEGIRTGELCETDPLQIMYSMFGANVFYFLSAPLMQLALPFKPFDPKALKQRRKAAVQFSRHGSFYRFAPRRKARSRVLRICPCRRLRVYRAEWQAGTSREKR